MAQNVPGFLKRLGYVDLTEAVTRFSAKGPAEVLPLDRMPKPVTEFLAYWKGKCGESSFPEYTAIDPVDIPRLLPNLMLWTPFWEKDALGFVCRLAGSQTEGPMRARLKGRTLHDLNGNNSERAHEEFEYVSRSGHLHYVERTAHWIDRPTVYYTRLLLPLARSGAVANDLVSILVYDASNVAPTV